MKVVKSPVTPNNNKVANDESLNEITDNIEPQKRHSSEPIHQMNNEYNDNEEDEDYDDSDEDDDDESRILGLGSVTLCDFLFSPVLGDPLQLLLLRIALVLFFDSTLVIVFHQPGPMSGSWLHWPLFMTNWSFCLTALYFHLVTWETLFNFTRLKKLYYCKNTSSSSGQEEVEEEEEEAFIPNPGSTFSAPNNYPIVIGADEPGKSLSSESALEALRQRNYWYIFTLWQLYSISISMHMAIVPIFWLVLFPIAGLPYWPRLNSTQRYLLIAMHGLELVALLLEFGLVRVPMELRNIVWMLAYCLVYLAIVVADSLFWDYGWWPYWFMEWHSALALINYAAVFFFLIAVYSAVYYLHRLRDGKRISCQ